MEEILSAHTAPSQKLAAVISIVNRGKGERVTEICRSLGITFNFICLGRGTATSEILDYLGLGETEKDIIISSVPLPKVYELIKSLKEKLHLSKPGSGIVFTVSITSVGGPQTLKLMSGFPDKGGEYSMAEESNQKQFELIITIVNRGFSDEVMQAAKSAGATGGTVLYARGTGIHEAEKFFGITIQPEKEVVLILVDRDLKQNIMKAVCRGCGLGSEGRGLSFALPVDDVFGIVHEPQTMNF